MEWEKLLSLKRFGDTFKRKRIDQDETRLGFEVDYDRIIFSSEFRSLQDKTQVVPFSQGDFLKVGLLMLLSSLVYIYGIWIALKMIKTRVWSQEAKMPQRAHAYPEVDGDSL